MCPQKKEKKRIEHIPYASRDLDIKINCTNVAAAAELTLELSMKTYELSHHLATIGRLNASVGFETRGAEIKTRHKNKSPIDFVHSSRPRSRPRPRPRPGKVEIKTGLELNSARCTIVSTSGIHMDIMNSKFGLMLIKHFLIGVIQSVILTMWWPRNSQGSVFILAQEIMMLRKTQHWNYLILYTQQFNVISIYNTNKTFKILLCIEINLEMYVISVLKTTSNEMWSEQVYLLFEKKKNKHTINFLMKKRRCNLKILLCTLS